MSTFIRDQFLDPLLFLIYINDICKAVPDAKVKLYADPQTHKQTDYDPRSSQNHIVFSPECQKLSTREIS